MLPVIRRHSGKDWGRFDGQTTTGSRRGKRGQTPSKGMRQRIFMPQGKDNPAVLAVYVTGGRGNEGGNAPFLRKNLPFRGWHAI